MQQPADQPLQDQKKPDYHTHPPLHCLNYSQTHIENDLDQTQRVYAGKQATREGWVLQQSVIDRHEYRNSKFIARLSCILFFPISCLSVSLPMLLIILINDSGGEQ